jgi:hypothetical protein
VIAARAVKYFGEAGMLTPVVESLAIALATTADHDNLRGSASGNLLIRLTRYRQLVGLLYRRVSDDVDRAAVRQVYSTLEQFLSGNYHYWLQRGAFEASDGDIDEAKQFIDQAMSMNGDDALVRTEWAHMTLKRASLRPEEPISSEAAETAFVELDELIASRGLRDYHPFHIYGSQGMKWSRRGPLSLEDQKRLLERLRAVVDRGLGLHPDQKELQQLRRDLETEYLSKALPENQPPEG